MRRLTPLPKRLSDPLRGIARWRAGVYARLVLAATIVLVGLALAVGGAWLAALGGSWYFLLAGAGLVASGVLLARRRLWGAWLYAGLFAATAAWALWEVGLAFWPLVSRLAAPAVGLVLVLLFVPALRHRSGAPPKGILAYRVATGGVVAALAVTAWAAFQPQPVITAAGPPQPVRVAQSGHVYEGAEWRHYGRQPTGTRYAPIDQITPANVSDLEIAWIYRTGDVLGPAAAHLTTPIQVGDRLYGCTSKNAVFALDVETGEARWTFTPDPAVESLGTRCRGVSYYEAPTGRVASAPAGPSGAAPCLRRIVLNTADSRLIMLDAGTGRPCEGFGQNGVVDLKAGVGPIPRGWYSQTAAPTVMGDAVIVGGRVYDNQAVNEPSGVVRAFSAVTGDLLWAFDVGAPERRGAPRDGETYTRGTPNVWSTPAYDASLGLVYLPMANATPDFHGAHRSRASEEYTDAIVAVEVGTGRERWRFRTVNHDLWDYDLPSQPALYDIPQADGSVLPALIQTTKRGDLFILDRRTGRPVTPVEQRPAPKGAAPGDWTAPTQPYQTGMPGFGNAALTEADMWGATPLDQLVCRIWFRRLRYEGAFTPPNTDWSLIYPGTVGGMNWGSSSVAENIGYLIVNDMRVGTTIQLVPRAEVEASVAAGDRTRGGAMPQKGAPYGVRQKMFMSPMGAPCQAPPYGTVSAVDLRTYEVVWQVPMGTIADRGPFGIRSGSLIPIGLPTLGGPITTRSGLVFFSGAQDDFLRALDVATGRELWKGRLPVAAETTPMTYVGPRSGRQFVVVSAGGGRNFPDRKGDYVIAFALPDRARVAS